MAASRVATANWSSSSARVVVSRKVTSAPKGSPLSSTNCTLTAKRGPSDPFTGSMGFQARG